ncbi:MAG: acyl-CoA dehydrogenase family protein [Fimbriimonadales bacterium]|nr:acyl-CoA dehydrogenase family protein [Fimbriimonadales bacterium]
MAHVPTETQASPGGSFLYSIPPSIFTPEDFDAESLLMVQTAKQFMLKEVMPLLPRLDQQEENLMPSLVKKACELGFGSAETPQEFGGLGLPKTLGTRILEMLSLDGAFSTTFGVQMGIAQQPIVLFGNKEQKRKYLPHLASGEWMGAYALSEPNSGSDALSMTTSAQYEENTRAYLITGTKMWVSNAKWANLFVVFAKVAGEHITCFLVERSFPRLTVGREEHKVGQKASSTARLVLDRTPVPEENILYQKGEGHRVAFNALNLGRLKLGAMALGQAREAIRVATRYARERKQFGKPLSHFGLIREKLAKMSAWFYASESILYRTAGLVDKAFRAVSPNAPEEEQINGNLLAAQEYQIECSLTKVLCSETLSLCADEALQIHGGYGYTEEFPVGRIWRDARVTRIYEGTNEINRLFISTRIQRKNLYTPLLNASPTVPAHAYLISSAQSAEQALQNEPSDIQQILSALSDLVILTYAQQSTRLRAQQSALRSSPWAPFLQACSDLFTFHSTLLAQARAREIQYRCQGSPHLPKTPEPHLPLPHDAEETIVQTLLEKEAYPLE